MDSKHLSFVQSGQLGQGRQYLIPAGTSSGPPAAQPKGQAGKTRTVVRIRRHLLHVAGVEPTSFTPAVANETRDAWPDFDET
jgi:hypothetical protein